MTAKVACYPANGSTLIRPVTRPASLPASGPTLIRPAARPTSLPTSGQASIRSPPYETLTPRPSSAERDTSGSTKSCSIAYPIQLHGHIPTRHIGPPYYFGPLSALRPIRGHYINTADSPSGISAPLLHRPPFRPLADSGASPSPRAPPLP